MMKMEKALAFVDLLRFSQMVSRITIGKRGCKVTFIIDEIDINTV